MSSLIIIFLFIYLIIIALAIVTIVASYKCFRKAGIPGWKALIPLYNSYLYSMLGTNNKSISLGYVALTICYAGLNIISGYSDSTDSTGILIIMGLLCIPILILGAVINFRFAKAFGQSDGFAVAYIFFAGILILVLAFSNDITYSGPLAADSDKDNDQWS